MTPFQNPNYAVRIVFKANTIVNKKAAPTKRFTVIKKEKREHNYMLFSCFFLICNDIMFNCLF